MALDPGSGRRSVSPESSGRDSPIPRQWRNQLGGVEPQSKDKAYRRYASGVDKALTLFETALEEWADYISFLNRLLKALQARPSSISTIPAKATVARRLSQCLNPSLPSGVHQKTLEVYSYIFSVIDKDGLSRDMPLYLPGLAPTLSFASLSVRSPYLNLLEQYFLKLDPRSLRPAMKSIILALLPGLEEETSEDFDRTLHLLANFKEAIRPTDSELLTEDHSPGDGFFWQCFFLASITSQSRRSGALAYLVRYLPVLGPTAKASANASGAHDTIEDALTLETSKIVTSPEPGLLVRCFTAGLFDDQLLIQRGFLDLLVTHLPLSSSVLQSRVKAGDLELLLRSAVGVVTRRDMSLNRRLWTWLLGPEPASADGDQTVDAAGSSTDHGYLASRTGYFENYGLQPLTKALLSMIKGNAQASAAELARPFRICLSLMDRWEIGGLVVPEVFLPVVQSVRQFQVRAPDSSEFAEILRSASVFFDGIESGLIYSELVGLMAQAIGPGSLTSEERSDKLSLINFIITHFNVREEEMVTIHGPLACLCALYMLEDVNNRRAAGLHADPWTGQLAEQLFEIVISLMELVPERAFQKNPRQADSSGSKPQSAMDVLKKIRSFYVDEQGNLEASPPPFTPVDCGRLLLEKAVDLVCDAKGRSASLGELGLRMRILILALVKNPAEHSTDKNRLLVFLDQRLNSSETLPFPYFSSMLHLCTQLRSAEKVSAEELSNLVGPLVRHAWVYLSASEPKFHVETVRCLWQLQTVLTTASRDIEAALAGIVVQQVSSSAQSPRVSDTARTFSVLWSHTLQDSPTDRRGSKTPVLELRSMTRLAGIDHFELMLTQPLFLVLDALLDERAHLHMPVRSWLKGMIGVDRLFLTFVTNLSAIPLFLGIEKNSVDGEKTKASSKTLSENDDLELCFYYLRVLYHILDFSADKSSHLLITKYLSFSEGRARLSTGGEDHDMSLQDYFVRLCMRCITADVPSSATQDFQAQAAELCRLSLTILHHFSSGQHPGSLANLGLENVLLDRLSWSIDDQDPYVQVLLLNVVYDVLKLREETPLERAISPTSEKRPSTMDTARPSRPSVSMSDVRSAPAAPPPQLLKCLRAGLSSHNSRSVLEHWIAFLGQCLPFYSDSVFQVLIPLVETLCTQLGTTFSCLNQTFANTTHPDMPSASEAVLIHLLNGLEQVLARAHDQLLGEEARAQLMKNPDQPQSLFGSMVSGVFQSDLPLSRSATANDRLTVYLAFQDAVRICYKIWCWGHGEEANKQDADSAASFTYTSLRMRNRARRLLEHLLAAETLECLETMIDVWKNSPTSSEKALVFNFLASLDASRPRQTMPALFNSIYSRTNPGALDPSRKSTMTISLSDLDLVAFLVEYARSLDDDAMDEIWQDCMTFLKDLLGNPFPHRQTLPSLLEFAAILGVKVDNTNFGEQRRMRRELGDLFLRLLAAMFTTRPLTFTEQSNSNGSAEKLHRSDSARRSVWSNAKDRPDDVVFILSTIIPNLPKILLESDRVLSAAGTISTNVIGPTLRSKAFPDIVSHSTMKLFHELTRLSNNQKSWKKDVGEAFNDGRFFGMELSLVKDDWLPLLKQWSLADKEKVPDIVGRINAPTTAGIVFGVGATSARLEADRKSQLNLRRIATLVLSSVEDAFVTDLPVIFEKLTELLAATAISSPSSTTRGDVYMVVRALVLKTSPIHLAFLWPVINAEIHAAISSVVAPDQSAPSETYGNMAILQACKLLDLLVCIAPDDFQLHEWLFVTDTIDAVYRSSSSQPVALVDELSEELGNTIMQSTPQADSATHLAASGPRKRPLLGAGGISDVVSLERKDELVAKVLRPFFAQLSIFAFESTYAMGALDREFCVEVLLKDIFDERTIVRAL